MSLDDKLRNSDSTLRIMSSIKDIRLDNFNDRLYLQKLGFLVQKIHQEEPFSFSWYVRGPYSSVLASTLFLHEEKKINEKPHLLSDKEEVTKKKIKDLLGKNMYDPFYLELYASLWYLMSKGQISKKENEEIIAIMYKDKPYFSREDVMQGLSKISEFRKKNSL